MSDNDTDKFWSGAIRCPKCESGMEQIKYDGVEIDRCSSCKGLWFDAGDVELLRSKAAAQTIDIGDPEKGKETNKTDHYACPRCGGNMLRLVDPRQSHIWYETCSSCRGSFFDAGEFLDLTEFTISDFFKRFTTLERE